MSAKLRQLGGYACLLAAVLDVDCEDPIMFAFHDFGYRRDLEAPLIPTFH